MKYEVQKRMLDAGAHYVIDTIRELPETLATINARLNNDYK